MEKSKARPKPGKVLRVDPLIWKFLSDRRKPKETNSALVRRLMGLPPRKGDATEAKTWFILPESKVACHTIEEARGAAIVIAVRTGKKKPSERPVEVREIAG
jgi:hypothetical protein